MVVGDGPLRSTMERRVREAGLDGRFIFTGQVVAKDVGCYLSLADAHVISSRMEGMPLAILEAFAAGVPTRSRDAARSDRARCAV
jgi:glycosyltransferase involved in cell wall biosynthesis